MRVCLTLQLLFRLLVLLLLAWPVTAQAEVSYTGRLETALLHQQNLSRANSKADEVADNAASMQLALSALRVVGDGDTASLSLRIGETAFARYSLLNHYELGLTARYRHKFGIGREVPWLAMEVLLGSERYHYALRDRNLYGLNLLVGQRFGERIEGTLSLRRDWSHARQPVTERVYDAMSDSLLLSLGYALGESTTLTAGLGWRRGDVVATTRRDADLFFASRAIARDPAFGPDYVAYRIHADTRLWQLRLDYRLSAHHGLGLHYRGEDAHPVAGKPYMGRQISFNYHYIY